MKLIRIIFPHLASSDIEIRTYNYAIMRRIQETGHKWFNFPKS